MALGNFRRAVSGLWVREEREANDAGAAPERAFRQLVERWVEFKRVHLSFAQTLNSLISKRSNLLQLIKFSMLCEEEAGKISPDSPLAMTEDLGLLIKALPAKRYARLYRFINKRAFEDDELSAVLDPGNLKVAEIILSVVGDAPARHDLGFVNLAEKAGYSGAERAEKWSREIAGLNHDLLAHYRTALRARGII